jgi:hypothetical protein
MRDYKGELKTLTEMILMEEENYGQMKKAADDLYDLLVEVSGMQEDEELVRADCFLPKGKAIGTVWAGRCVKEFYRTKQFLKGTWEAIKKVQETFQNQTIHILYAGPGPFGTLLIPLTTLFTDEKIKITFLEINAESIKCLKNVIQTFEAESYVEEIIQCDATEYQAPEHKPIHMIVTETMQNALKKEPQVAITQNLVPQMLEGGILIPQTISVKAVLMDEKRNMERTLGEEGAVEDFYYLLGEVLELSQDTIRQSYKDKKSFPNVEVDIPTDLEKRFNRISLFTDIQVFEEAYLTYVQCSLNMPLTVKKIDPLANPIKKVGFQYVINETPGFVYQFH